MMNKILQISVLLFFTVIAKAQVAKTYLDINDVKAVYLADGRMFWEGTSSFNAGYQVPKNDPKKKHTIFASGIMIGGVDAGGQLHTAGMTYRQRGTDFWPGPLDVNTALPNDPPNWNRLWNVKKSTIDYHRANYQTPNYIVPQEIAEWPGNGPLGCAPILAPFFDIDGDGLYEPIGGDYPIIKGDQAVFFIINDNGGVHSHYPGGEPLKIEIHCMAWARTSTNKFLDQATFLSYTIFNRSTSTYYNVNAGLFMDFDLGNAADDYIATDSSRNMTFCYNADSLDEDGASAGYGKIPPDQGLLFLDRKLDNTMVITNTGIVGINSDPVNATELYRYLNGYWPDGSFLTYGTPSGRGGTVQTKYSFSGDLCPKSGWNETMESGDRRAISSIRLDTLYAGGKINFNVALVYARGDSGIISSECKLEQAADYLQDEFDSGKLTGIKVNNSEPPKIMVNPNPVFNESEIDLNNLFNEAFEIIITDYTGKIIREESGVKNNYKIRASDFISGLYIIKIKSTRNEFITKFIIK